MIVGSALSKTLTATERFLGSKVVEMVCFAVLANKLLTLAGFGWLEYLLAVVVYINITGKLDAIQAALDEGR